MNALKISFLLLPVLLFIPSTAFSDNCRPEIIKVGIYQNPPKVYLENDGTPAGFIVKIMEEIAGKESWKIEYVFDSWSENISRLQNNEIHIMLDVTRTGEWEELFNFNNVPLIESWLQVFSKKPQSLEKISDLDGLRLAVLEGSVQHNYFSDRVSELYNIKYTLLTYKKYEDTVMALETGEADAVIADRFFYFSEIRNKNIHPTPIILKPAGIHFAFTSECCIKKMNRIDEHLALMKNEPDSAYYKALQLGLAMPSHRPLPAYVIRIAGITTAVLLFLAAAVFFQRDRIKKKTKELSTKNIELEKARNRLETALEEKNNLITELFHRTRNNMQVISSILGLEASKSSGSEIRDSFTSAINKIHSLSIVHEMLYENSSLTHIDFSSYIRKLAEHLKLNHEIPDRQINFSFDMEPVQLLFDYASPCGLVLNELISNSLKHSITDRPSDLNIYISLKSSDGSKVSILYRDDSLHKQAFENTYDNDSGLSLIIGIVEKQLKGSIRFIPEEGNLCEIIFITEGYKERI